MLPPYTAGGVWPFRELVQRERLPTGLGERRHLAGKHRAGHARDAQLEWPADPVIAQHGAAAHMGPAPERPTASSAAAASGHRAVGSGVRQRRASSASHGGSERTSSRDSPSTAAGPAVRALWRRTPTADT